MDISQVIQFEGNVDDLVWKSPVEDFNTSSILVCDETHEAPPVEHYRPLPLPGGDDGEGRRKDMRYL